MKAISKGPILVKTTLEEQCFIGLSFDLNIGSRSLHIIYPTSNYAWIIRQMQETRGEKTSFFITQGSAMTLKIEKKKLNASSPHTIFLQAVFRWSLRTKVRENLVCMDKNFKWSATTLTLDLETINITTPTSL